jgi:hypothetical protein
MSSTSSSRRGPPPGAAASPSKKRARDDTGASPSDSASAKNPRRGFSSSPFADFGSYMSAKNSKLAAQFDADASKSVADSRAGGLFAGVSIFVDGFTVPSSQVAVAYHVVPTFSTFTLNCLISADFFIDAPLDRRLFGLPLFCLFFLTFEGLLGAEGDYAQQWRPIY